MFDTNVTKHTDDMWEIHCTCGSKDHRISIMVDEEINSPNDIEIEIFSDLFKAPEYYLEWNPLKKLWGRIKSAYQILFYGRVEVQTSIVMGRDSFKKLKEDIDRVVDEK